MRTALFWVITHRVVVIAYRSFGPTYPSLEDQRSSQIGDPGVVWGNRVSSTEGSCAQAKSLRCQKSMTSELQNVRLLCHAVQEVH